MFPLAENEVSNVSMSLATYFSFLFKNYGHPVGAKWYLAVVFHGFTFEILNHHYILGVNPPWS